MDKLLKYYQVCIAVVFTVLLQGVVVAAESEFSCVAWGELPYSDLTYRSGTQTTKIELVSDRRSELYPLHNKGVFELYAPKELANGTMGFGLVGRKAFAPGGKRMLFLISKSPEGAKLPLSILAMDDSLEAFPPGSFRVANFTRSPFDVTLGDVKQALPAKSVKLFKATMRSGGGIVLFNIWDSKGKPVFGRRLFGQNRTRQVIFITPSEEVSSPLRIKILPEIIESKSGAAS